MAFNSSPEKHQYVNAMFARIAHRYDVMNRIMTLGQDRQWRKLLIKNAQLPPYGKLLDIATGTGDIAFEALQQHPNLSHVVGADFTLPMMYVGQRRWTRRCWDKQNTQTPFVSGKTLNRKSLNEQLSWSGADTLHLPYQNNSFNAVASGFLMRNVTSVRQALVEQVRVCKPGGRLLILEIPRPPDNLFGAIFRLYFHNVVPFLGGLITGQRDAYNYLPASADTFLRPEELKVKMKRAGLHNVSYTMLMLNTVALHVGIK
jgi:demethylmenaquinone methyltransferase/2-methoxy-6-polyprenyl-1,4-benzoquinol methylase